jgi:hypothetical protein
VTRYAARTSVPVERSRSEIERVLAGYGCSQFQSGWESNAGAHVAFRVHDTAVMIHLPMADPAKIRSEARRRAEERRRWRCLLLIIKAKLEAVQSGISSFEREFLADVVLPNGVTMGQWAVPHLKALQSGQLALPAHEK